MSNGHRRDRILSAARSEFASKGFAGARTATIAERARVNKQLIFYYFKSKAGLYSEVVEEIGGVLQSAGGVGSAYHETASPAERIRATLRLIYDAVERKPELAGLLVRGMNDPGGGGRRLLADMVGDLIGRLTAVISHGQGTGHFRDDVDPETAARSAIVLALGYLALENVLSEGPTPERRAQWLDSSAALLLRALSW